MNRQKVPAYILLIALIYLGVFVDAPLISRQVKVPCYVGPTGIVARPASYLNETEWMSPSYAFFGIGVLIPPADPCANAP